MGLHSRGSAGLCASCGDSDQCSQGPRGLGRLPAQPLRGPGRQGGRGRTDREEDRSLAPSPIRWGGQDKHTTGPMQSESDHK